MTPRILFSLAHKGGTGRSLASINLAFQLALRGRNVALLDLDVVGGTLHHISRPIDSRPDVNLATFEKRTKDLSEQNTLLQYLYQQEDQIQPKEVYSEDLFAKHRTPSLLSIVPRSRSRSLGRLTLFPRGGTALPHSSSNFGEQLTKFFRHLFDIGVDVVISDMQAGISNTLTQTVEANSRRDFDACWMIYVRATPQHVAGAQDLIKFVSTHRSDSSPMWLIPTAIMSFSDASSSTDSSVKTTTLAKHVWDRLSVELSKFRQLYGIEIIDPGLSFEKALQWSEGIAGQDGYADDYFASVANLAETLNL